MQYDKAHLLYCHLYVVQAGCTSLEVGWVTFKKTCDLAFSRSSESAPHRESIDAVTEVLLVQSGATVLATATMLIPRRQVPL